MYLNRPTEKRTAREAWTEYISEEAPVCAGSIDPESRREIINAMAAYCEDAAGDGALRAELIPQLFLRAASAIGGSRIQASRSAETHARAELFTALIHNRDLPDRVRELIAIGWFRPLGGKVIGAGHNWALAVGRIVSGADNSLEMALFMEIKRTLSEISVVWNQSDGKGALALCGVQRAVRGMLGKGVRRGRASMLVLELRGFCADLLARSAEKNGWKSCPAVVVRDVRGI